MFEIAGKYLYTGGLFLSTTGSNDRKNLSRFNMQTEHWESVPGINSGFNGGVWDIHNADDGYIYIGGNFSQVGGAAAQGIARFDPVSETWEALIDPSPTLVTVGQENGPTNGRVFAIQKIGDLVYVGGEFTGPSRSPADEKYIRSYNVVSKKWAKVGGTLDSDVRALTVAPNGDLIAGGGFEGTLSRWNGTAWTTISGGARQNEGGGIVREVKYAADGTLYIAGDFDRVGEAAGITTRDVAAIKDGVWNPLAGGFDDTYIQSNGTTFNSDGVYDLAVGTDGKVYASGDFDASNGRTVTNLRHIAMWDGTGAWKAMGSGVGTTGSQIINCVEVAPDQTVFVGGVFNEGHKNAGSAKFTFARWDVDRDFTDYVPGAADNSTLRIITLEEKKIEVTFQTKPGTTYQMDASSDLTNWVEVTNAVVDGNGNRQGFNLNVIEANRQRYYRYRATR